MTQVHFEEEVIEEELEQDDGTFGDDDEVEAGENDTWGEEEKAEEGEAAPIQPVSGFQPEPLHVRAMCCAERRNIARHIEHESANMHVRKENIVDLEQENNPFKLKEAKDDLHRARYRMRLLGLRQQRLNMLDPSTHSQLPDQMIEAAADGDLHYVKFGIEAKVQIDTQDSTGKTALIAAAVTNKLSVVTLLLEQRADPRVQDVNGATCCHYAVQLQHIHVMKAILDIRKGTNWDAFTLPDSRGLSAIDYARCPDRATCMQLLRARMGGPPGVLWQLFRGWMSRTTKNLTPKEEEVEEKKKRGRVVHVAEWNGLRMQNVQEMLVLRILLVGSLLQKKLFRMKV